MKLESQVTSLEISKRLKELGVKQESFFDWECKMGNWSLIWGDYHVHPYIDTADVRKYVSAFTVAELGEMLKHPSQSVLSFHNYVSVWTGDNWAVYLQGKLTVEADTEADARGKMMIYLLENNLLPKTN